MICQINRITKAYKEKMIFNNFSYNIEQGDFICLTGKSGSGKSTLINMIGCLDNPDSGEILLFNETEMKRNAQIVRKYLAYKLGFLFQNFALIDDESIKENLLVAMQHKHLKKRDKTNCMLEALDRVGLDRNLKTKIYQLSGGEQQKVALARLLLKDCELILADEPTGALDPYNSGIVIRVLKELNSQGKTIILATHDLSLKKNCNKHIDLDSFCDGLGNA